MESGSKKRNEKLSELGDAFENANIETKIDIYTDRTGKPEQKNNCLLKLKYAFQNLPNIYKIFGVVALINLIIIGTLFFYSA